MIIDMFQFKQEKWLVKQIATVDYLIQKAKENPNYDPLDTAYKSLKDMQIRLNYQLTVLIKKRTTPPIF